MEDFETASCGTSFSFILINKFNAQILCGNKLFDLKWYFKFCSKLHSCIINLIFLILNFKMPIKLI
ncbi:hypothetical protein BpHYR1_033424 [Brachionus plicatilis]|uniref:Uncharacterized protein n=1 Tax=Brachionus plicatilis TaxID=10195 RepID=A0A3M7RLT9_BRAPC|nr:hypothetical protein BpHYR1_033424 [Brachionus plicatilis]